MDNVGNVQVTLTSVQEVSGLNSSTYTKKN